MPAAEGKDRVMITLTEEELAWVDEMATRFRMSRSQVVGKCVQDAAETLGMMDGIGLSPENMAAVLDRIYRMWNVIGSPFKLPVEKKRKP